MSHTHNPGDVPYLIPRKFLFGCIGLAAITVAFVAFVQVTGHGKVERTMGAPVAERSLVFRDGDKGVVNVLDADTRTVLRSFGAGEGAFLRSAMRTMAFKRKGRGLSTLEPYSLIRTDAGELVLLDPLTSQTIKPRTFGTVAMNDYDGLIEAGPLAGATFKN